MFDLGWQELLIIAIVTLIVVGPKDLPKLFNRAGKLVGNIKQISREFFDKVNEAAEVDEINELKTSMSDIADFDSFEGNKSSQDIGSRKVEEKKKIIPKKTKKVLKKNTKIS